MKKKKSLLLASLSLVSAFTCACAFGCSQANPDDEVLKGNYEGAADVVEDAADNWVLQSIAVETTGLKTEYNYGEEFEQTKPVVKATFATLESVIKVEENKLNESSAIRLETEERVLSAEDVKVDFGQYDKNSVGTYNIYVSYTHAGVTRMASYTVTVKSINPSIGGITAHTENFVDTYYIENEAGVNVSLEGLYFLNVDAEQNIDYDNPIQPATEENPDGYKLTYYAGGTVIESLEGLQKGEYTVMASYNGAKAFVIISVLDPVASVVIKPETENAKFEQVQSPVDELTSTWQFTVTYASGLTKTVKKGDEGVLIGNIVTVTAASRATTMSYTEDNETVSVSVPYTITADPGLVEGVNSMSISALTDINASPLLPSHMTGDNAFITPLGKLRHRKGNNASFVDFNGEALTVTTNGFGSLEIAVRSTGGANVSGFYLADEEGKYISGVFEAGTGISEVQLSGGTAYLVTDAVSTSFKTITFILPKAGTYKLGSLATGSAGVTQAYTRMNKLVLTDVFDNTIDRTSYEFAIDTTNVKKDYIAGQTAADLSKEGLTAVLKEIHTVDTDKNTQTSVTAENLSITLTDGDMSKLNSTGTVTVTYTAEGGKEYTATYTINIKSPVTGVNSVALTKEILTYNLESETATVDLNKSDIVLHANNATGDVITLGEGDSVTYKLFKGEQELTEWTGLGEGTYIVKATVVLKNTEAAVPGTTTFTPADLTITIKPYVPSGEASPYEDFFLENVGSAAAFTATSYGVGSEITDNTLFTANAGVALTTSIGSAYGNIQHNGGSNKVEFADTKGITHNPDVGIALTENASAEKWFTVTAKENITLFAYITFANQGYNSNKPGTLSYKVNNGASTSSKLDARKNVWKVEVRLNKGEVVAFSAIMDDETNKGMGWLFGLEAKKEESAVERPATYSITYNINSDDDTLKALTLPETQVVNKDEKATAPEAFPAVAGWTFGGWYTTAACDGEAYDFDSAVISDIVLYAKWTQVTSATVTFDANGHGTAPEAQALNIGETATDVAIKAAGWTFDGWYTEATGGEKFDFTTAISADIILYAHWTEITYPATFTYSYADIAAKNDNGAMTDNDLVLSNAFLTKLGGTLNYRTNGNIEIRNDALSVTFTGSGTLKITVSSTGSGATNYSALVVKDAEGKYIEAAYNTEDTNVRKEGNVYVVYGTAGAEFTFNITEAGTYTIGTENVSFSVGEATQNTNRNTRIKGIEMKDSGAGETSIPDPTPTPDPAPDPEEENETINLNV